MKIRKITLIQYYYLIHKPYLNVASCPLLSFISKGKIISPQAQMSIQDHTLYLAVMSLWFPLFWAVTQYVFYNFEISEAYRPFILKTVPQFGFN